MGSHVDTPEWQSFERRMRERYASRRRRMRARWVLAIAGGILIGLTVAPPRIERRSATRTEPMAASASPVNTIRLQRASTVTVQRIPFAATVIVDEPRAVPTTMESPASHLPPPTSPEPSLPDSRPEPEPLAAVPVEAARRDPPVEPAVPALPPAESRPSPSPPIASTATATITPAAPAVNVEQDVRKVIERYRDAYERLDAAAAHAVWPGVDQAALARAFDGLAAQRIAFERCDIWRDAQAAFASCAGRASYVPKVGSAQNDVPRAWHFRLRRREAGWTIESAEVR